MVSYIGNFGAGFVNAYLRSRAQHMQEAMYAQQINYYMWLMGKPPVYHFAGEQPEGPSEEGGFITREASKVGQVGHGGKAGDFTYEEMITAARKAGFEGDDAAHIVAIAMAESSGKLGAVNPKTHSAGLTQINPHAWGQDLADKAKGSLQGAFDAAKYVYDRQGWGAWAVDPSSKFFDTKDDMSRFLPNARVALHNIERGVVAPPETEVAKAPAETKPAETSTEKTAAGPQEGKPSPAGGPWVKSGNNLFQTDKKGVIKPDTGIAIPVAAADQPSKAATPEAMMVPSGGQFRLPGSTQLADYDPRVTEGRRDADISGESSAAADRARERSLYPPEADWPPPDVSHTGYPDMPIGVHSGYPDTGDVHSGYPDMPVGVHSGYPDMPVGVHSGYPDMPIGVHSGYPDMPVGVHSGVDERGQFLYPPINRYPPGGALDRPEESGIPFPEKPLTASSETNKPTKKAKEVSAEKKAPKEAPKKAIPEPSDNVMYGMPVGGRGGGHETPTGMVGGEQLTAMGKQRDPFWRPNFPLSTKTGQEEAAKRKPDYVTPPTGVSQIVHNIRSAIGLEQPHSPVAGPTAVNTSRPASETMTTDERKAEATRVAASIRPPSTDTGGGEGGGGPSVQTPDTPPSPTNLPVEHAFAGQDVTGTGRAQQLQTAQLIQAQPVPVARRQDEAMPADEGDVSPTVLGAAKGGPIGIPTRPIWKAQTGGAAPMFPGSPGISMPSSTANPSSGYTQRGYVTQNPNAPYSESTIQGLYDTNFAQAAQDVQADVNAMSPTQQTYVNQQNALRSGNPYTNQPAPYSSIQFANTFTPPTFTPATTTPTTTPTVTPPTVAKTVTPPITTTAKTAVNPASTGTGTTQPAAPNLTWASWQSGTLTAPNTTAGAATYGDTSYGTPVVSTPKAKTPQSPSGAVYNVDTSGTITGARRGGPIQRYDDGGGVSPATLGMPPGLSPGQGQPVPPIYYNPANFSPYGAGVGRGFTQANTATYGAQGIPTYAGGGVVKYQDAGPVGYSDATASSEDQPAATDVSFGGGMIYTPHAPSYPVYRTPHIGNIGGGGGLGGGMRMGGVGRPPRAYAGTYAGGGDGADRYIDQNGNFLFDEEGNRIKPEGLSGETPQINDGYGNLSYGATSALTSVLHFLGNALGLGGPQTGVPPNHPMVQTNRRDVANDVPIAGVRDSAEAAINSIDPTNTLNRELKVIGVMEATYRWHLEHGDPEGAVRGATTMYMYLNHIVGQYGKAAIQSYQNGDPQGMLDNLSNASENIPNGQHFEGHWDFDENKAIVTQTDLNGKVLWHGPLSPEVLLAIATRAADGRMAYGELERVAGEHDPETRKMADEKRKEAEDEKQAALANEAYRQRYGGRGGALQQPGATMPGGGPPPQVTPAAATTPAPASVTAGSLAPTPAAAQGPAPPASPVPPTQPPPPTPGSAGTGGTTGAPTTGADASAPGPGDTLTPRAEPAVAQRQSPAGRLASAAVTPPPRMAYPPADPAAIQNTLYSKFYDPQSGEPLDRTGEPVQPVMVPGMSQKALQKQWEDWRTDDAKWRQRYDDHFKAVVEAQVKSAGDIASASKTAEGQEFTATKTVQGQVATERMREQADARAARRKSAEDIALEGIKEYNTREATTRLNDKPIDMKAVEGMVYGYDPERPDIAPRVTKDAAFTNIYQQTLARALSPDVTIPAEAAKRFRDTFRGKNDSNDMENMLKAGIQYGAGRDDPSKVAEVIVGGISGNYDLHITPIVKKDFVGNQVKDPNGERWLVTIQRPDGSGESITLPRQQADNLNRKAMEVFARQQVSLPDDYKKYAQEQWGGFTDTTPMPKEPPAIPGAGGAATQGGFNAPSVQGSPEWWNWFRQSQNAPGGPPPFGVPPTQPTKGFP